MIVDSTAVETLWRNALAVIPVVLLIAVACRWLTTRSTTRHSLWLVALVLFAVGPFVTLLGVPEALVSRLGPIGAPDVSLVASSTEFATGTTRAGNAQSNHEPARLAGAGAGFPRPAPAVFFTTDPASGIVRPPASTPGRTPVEAASWLAPIAIPAGEIALPDEQRLERSHRDELPVAQAASTDQRSVAPGGLLAAAEPFLRSTAAMISAEPGVFLGDASMRHQERAGVDGAAQPEGAAPAPSFGRSFGPGPSDAPPAPALALAGPDQKPARHVERHYLLPAGLLGILSALGAAPAPGPADGSAVAAGAAGSLLGEWDRWAAQLVAVQDAIMSLPPFPALLWIGGVVMILLVVTVRTARTLRLVRRATPAPAAVVRLVAEASRSLELKATPVTFMVAERLSPMVWCGRAPRLVLPQRLWEQLDEVGRRAVVYHELAHLKRRDHWVCWVEMIIGCVYWWHPVVWFVRRRLREEADLCCDAWVTAMLPTSRRAYAQALLDTRSYLGTLRPAGPAIGLGVSSVRAKRFARRLTMVMTEQKTPRLSFRGAALACTVAAAAYLVTPVLACPPKPKDPVATKPEKPLRNMRVRVPQAPRAPQAATRPDRGADSQPEQDDETTFEQFMRDRDRRPEGADEEVDERIRELEQQIDRLYKRLQELMERSGRLPRGEAREPQVLDLDGRAADPRAGIVQSAEGATPADPCTTPYPRSYRLPSGKLEALVGLMGREDVPILIRPGNGAIEVHATLPQHQVFESFCVMIHGKDCDKAYLLPKGKLDALTELMVRSDVPILVRPGTEKLTVKGTDLEHLTFRSFVKMINPGGEVVVEHAREHEHEHEHEADHERDRARAREQAAADRAVARHLDQIARRYEHSARQEIAARSQLESMLVSLGSQITSLNNQAEHLREQTEKLLERAETVEREAEELEASAEEVKGPERAQRLARVNGLLIEARQLGQQATMMQAQADAVLGRAESVEAEAERVEERLADLEDEAEEQDEGDGDDGCGSSSEKKD